MLPSALNEPPPPTSEIMAGLVSICERLNSILGRLKFTQQNNLDDLLICFDYLATEEREKMIKM